MTEADGAPWNSLGAPLVQVNVQRLKILKFNVYDLQYQKTASPQYKHQKEEEA